MISVENVSKHYRIRGSGLRRLAALFRPPTPAERFTALDSVSFRVKAGESLGVIGRNGAGKSTLLKLISGISQPSEGRIETDGLVAALLELGTGFHGELTGRRNIYINGQFLGIPEEVLRSLEDEIIAFSELGEFIDQPLRTYSSGMMLRLGFSIAVSIQPGILIVDEALSVGDARFSAKCVKRIEDLRSSGTTLLFVSHDPQAVLKLCDRAILLEKGRLVNAGDPKSIMEDYTARLAELGESNMGMTRRSTDSGVMRYGTFKAFVESTEILSESGSRLDVVTSGEVIIITCRVVFLTNCKEPTVGILIRDRLGNDIFGTNTEISGTPIGPVEAGMIREVRFLINADLAYGDYSIVAAVHEDTHHLDHCFDWNDEAARFSVRVESKSDWVGLARLRHQVTVVESSEQLSAAEMEKYLRDGVGDERPRS